MYPSTKISYGTREFNLFGFSVKDYIFNRWRSTGKFYEEPLLEKIRSLNISGCYVDAGANQGNHAIFFSEFCNSSEIVAVEASGKILPVFKLNLAGSVSKPCEIYHRCLYSEIGLKANAFGGVSPENCGSTTFVVTPDDSGEVGTTTLDNLLVGKDVGFMKLDIEGMELSALEGAVETLERCRPVIVAEALDAVAKFKLDELFARLNYRLTYTLLKTHCWEPL